MSNFGWFFVFFLIGVAGYWITDYFLTIVSFYWENKTKELLSKGFIDYGGNYRITSPKNLYSCKLLAIFGKSFQGQIYSNFSLHGKNVVSLSWKKLENLALGNEFSNKKHIYLLISEPDYWVKEYHGENLDKIKDYLLNERKITVFYYSTPKESFLDESCVKVLKINRCIKIINFYIVKIGMKYLACNNIDRYYTEREFNIEKQINQSEAVIKATKAQELIEMWEPGALVNKDQETKEDKNINFSKKKQKK